jgi:hypothetical protein
MVRRRFDGCEFPTLFTVSSTGFILTSPSWFWRFPLLIVERLKLIALFVAGEGHFVILITICAYGASLLITERLFVILKPKLLTLL